METKQITIHNPIESTSGAPSLPTLTTGESMRKHKAARAPRSSSPKLFRSTPLAEVKALAVQTKAITDEKANNLMADIFADCEAGSAEADRIAAAVLKFADALAYELDEGERIAMAISISRAAYGWTKDCCEAMDRFALSAGVTFGEGLPREMAA